MITTVTAEVTDRSRKVAVLIAAQPVFLRYGYRKSRWTMSQEPPMSPRKASMCISQAKRICFEKSIKDSASICTKRA